ncbi:unnamed protein product [Trifolium pratense]|uniref:Uncharacterized protein n=1 Tax=Trifolium pratense TaxID=57577 RepID=A0ACB0LAS1_TRIPR|nr:unnamed protein product [Trifolium pratense]
MANNDWDLYSIVSSNNVTTFNKHATIFETSSLPQTSTTIITTNNIVLPQNTTPSYFNDFNLTHESSGVHMPPSSPTHTTFIPMPSSPTNINTTTTIADTSVQYSYQNANYSIFNEQQQMQSNDWDLYSIVSSNKVTTFTNPTTNFETSSLPQTSTTITTTNNIVSPQNTTPSYFNDFNLTHENSVVPMPSSPTHTTFILMPSSPTNINTTTAITDTSVQYSYQNAYPIFSEQQMQSNNWDLYSIVSSNKGTTFTNPATIFDTSSLPKTSTTITTTNNIVSPQNTTPSYFNHFNFTNKNSAVPMPFAPTHTTFIPMPSSPTNKTTTTTIIPTHTTTTTAITNTSVQCSNHNSTFFDYPIFSEQQQMQSNDCTESEKMLIKYDSTITTTTFTLPISNTTAFTIPKTATTIPTGTTSSTTIIPTITPITNTITSFYGTNQNATFSNLSTLINQHQIQPNNENQVFVPKPYIETTTADFDRAYNQPLFSPQPIAHPQQPKSTSRKR